MDPKRELTIEAHDTRIVRATRREHNYVLTYTSEDCMVYIHTKGPGYGEAIAIPLDVFRRLTGMLFQGSFVSSYMTDESITDRAMVGHLPELRT